VAIAATQPLTVDSDGPRPSAAERATIAVIGAGTMGRGLVQLAAATGHPVVLFDRNADAVEQAVQIIGTIFRRAAEKAQISTAQAHAAIARVRGVPTIEALASADLVIESVVEDLEVKRRVFAAVEPVLREHALLTTNTSSLLVASIASACRRPERVAGLHFFNPVPVRRVVEVVQAPRTSDATITRLVDIVGKFGHTPIVVGDTPGFIVNHAARGLFGEALRILEEGVAPAHDIDAVVRGTLGFQLGPFEMMDITGLDAAWAIQRSIFSQFFAEPRFRPVSMVAGRVAAGLLGRKTGEGFYRYQDGDIVRPQPARVPDGARSPIWISQQRPAFAARVAKALHGAIDTAAGPNSPAGAVHLITPAGIDATHTAIAERADPSRTVAVDAAFPLDRHVTLMPTPATDAKALAAVHAGFARAGRSVTVIQDSAGFVAQRMAAMMVAVAAAMVETGIAAPADIDRAVTLALGYPIGPLALGDRLGPRVVVEMLENLQATTGDARWRTPAWLRRRALLGMTLSSDAKAPPIPAPYV
jgi:3-hydroxybutyryl-CoA dehydrogenase